LVYIRGDFESGDRKRRVRADAAAVSAAELTEAGATATDDDGETTGTRTSVTRTPGTLGTPGTQGAAGNW